ncbi:hypothetical protein C6P99_05610 [Burkholderia multivorans]|uniref:Uncharacterized protein n=1 Tax=Burkholderia multivorans TaxID=87883 RepID=A0AB37AZJ4_9BURK|nr:hypothetical protein C6P99_05610 [Burkholderia multivorans]
MLLATGKQSGASWKKPPAQRRRKEWMCAIVARGAGERRSGAEGAAAAVPYAGRRFTRASPPAYRAE